MKPIYQLTPISDHAKEMLAYIDKAKKDNQIQENFVETGKVDTNRQDKHDTLGKLYGYGELPEHHPYKHKPTYTEEQVKGLESMYGHNRAKLVDTAIKHEKSVRYYKHVSLVIPNEKLENFKGVFFDKCIIEFCNQDLAGQLYNQGCRFDDCRIIYHLHATQMNYSLTRK